MVHRVPPGSWGEEGGQKLDRAIPCDSSTECKESSTWVLKINWEQSGAKPKRKFWVKLSILKDWSNLTNRREKVFVIFEASEIDYIGDWELVQKSMLNRELDTSASCKKCQYCRNIKRKKKGGRNIGRCFSLALLHNSQGEPYAPLGVCTKDLNVCHFCLLH